MKLRIPPARLAAGTALSLAIALVVPSAAVAAPSSPLNDPAQVLAGRVSLQAQRICNGVFITGLSVSRYTAMLEKFNAGSLVQDLFPAAAWNTTIDRQRRSVTIKGTGSSLPASTNVTVQNVPGYGCVPLAADGKLHFTPVKPHRQLESASASSHVAWPAGDLVKARTWKNAAGKAEIDADVNQLFQDSGQFGFTLAYKGQLIDEHYAPGLTSSSAADGYSLTKSLIATLIGALIQKGWLRLDSPGGLPSWRNAGDPRGKVTVDNLLRMESGLSFPMTSGPDGFADYTPNALAASEIPGDTLARLNQLQVQTAPGGESHYLNANYELLSARAAEVLKKHGMNVVDGYYNLVFDKIDMRSLQFRSDAYGHITGPRHASASARDWNRLGQLYMNNGRWNGQQILPTWWRSYVSRSSGLSDGGPQRYGAGFWLDVPGDDATQANMLNQPADALFGNGASYQYIVMWPKEGVVMTITSDGADSQVPLAVFQQLSGTVLRLANAQTLG